MAKNSKQIEIDIDNLLVDQENFRIGPQESQADSIKAMIEEQGDGLPNLAQHIAENGLSPNKTIIVAPHPKDKGFYIVMDGNRRATAIKLVKNPTLANGTKAGKKFAELNKKHGKTIQKKIPCVQLSTEEAQLWRRIDHYKDQKGVSQEMWSSVARERADRADGKKSAVLDALDFVLAGNLITDATRQIAQGTDFELSSFERFLNYVPARSRIGIEIKKKSIVSKKPRDWLLEILSEIVTAIATKKFDSKKFAVKDIYTADDAASFADKVVKKVGDTTKRAVEWTVNHDNAPVVNKAPLKAKKVKPAKPVPPQDSWNRTTLIPLEYPIKKLLDAKLNNIYSELKKINPAECPNGSALLLRTLLELSLKLFCTKNKITVCNNPKDWTVKAAAAKAVEYLRNNKGWDKNTAAKIQSILQKQPISITTELNSYVHHKDFHPEWIGLNTAWDNLQPFFDAVWVDFK
jgi:hypothetical protein